MWEFYWWDLVLWDPLPADLQEVALAERIELEIIVRYLHLETGQIHPHSQFPEDVRLIQDAS